MPSPGRVFRWLAIGVGALLLLLGLAFVIATRTGPGQEFVMDRVLRYLEGSLRGRITVQDVTSANGLQRGVKLRGVSVTAMDGSTVLSADSLQMDYDLRGLITGRIVLRDVALWSPVVLVANAEPGGAYAVQTLLPEADTGAGGGPERVVLEGVSIENGRIDVRQRLPEGAGPGRIRAERIPGDDGWVRTVTLDRIGASLRRVGIITPEEEGIQVDIGGFAARVLAVEDPLEIDNVTGRIGYVDERVTLGADLISLPHGTRASGVVTVDLQGEDPVVELTLAAPEFHTDDVAWLLPSLPEGRGGVELGLYWDSDDLRVSLTDGRLDFGDGVVSGNSVLSWSDGGGVARLSDTDVGFESLSLAVVEAFSERDLPVDGAVSGRLRVSGSFARPTLNGTVTHEHPDYPSSTVELNGTLVLGDDPGAENLELRVRRLSLGLVDVFADAGLDASRIVEGSASLHGRLGTGLELDVTARYPDPEGTTSVVAIRGTIRDLGEELAFDLAGSAEPLYIHALVTEDSPLRSLGRAEGTLGLRGTTSDLTFTTDLETEQGSLSVTAGFDARNPFDGYDITAEASDFDVTALVPALPGGTVLTGRMDLSGSGRALDSADIRASAQVVSSTVAHLAVDSLSFDGTVRAGIFTLDTVQGRVGRAAVRGGGTLGTGGRREGVLHLSLESDDLGGIRPYFLGPGVIAGDTLSPLSRQILALDGIDADTLPTLAEVQMGGSVSAEVTLRGALDSLSISGDMELLDAMYGGNFVERARVGFTAEGLPSVRPRIDALVETGRIRIMDRAFDSASVRLDYQEPRGRTDIFLVRSPREDYRAHVAFDWGDSVRVLNLDEMTLRFEEDRWNLGGPATIRWEPDGLTFRDLRLIRPGGEGFRLFAQGRFPFRGPADLDLSVERLNLERVAHILQLSDTLRGTIDAEFQMGGTARNPQIRGSFAAADLRWTDFAVDRMESTFDYADRGLEGDVEVWQSGRQVLSVEGRLPADLAVGEVEVRFPDEAVDLSVAIDSLPLRLLMSPFPAYSEVGGTISGSVEVGGTLDALAPDGEIRIDGASAYLESVGVRHRSVEASVQLRPDGTVGVRGSLQARGRAELEGTVRLDPASDPPLDLRITLDNFQALQRQDVEVRLSGAVDIGGSYRRPVMTGDLSVREGTLYLEEFIRSTSVLDLASLAAEESTSILESAFLDAPGIIGGQNPFLRNILMRDLTLSFTNNAWVESDEMRVEMGGELDVLYDRAEQEISLQGTLNALRGNYRTFGRQFNVQDGTLRFFGTPGINPELDIRAVTRVRGQDRSTIAVTANVTGTLIAPRVTLTSDQAGLSQEDLISYMLFGRPAYGLTASQSQALGAAGNLLVGSGLTFGLQGFNTALSSAASELGLGLAYVSLTQQNLGSGGESFFGATVLETGAYLADDFFLTLLLRPPSDEREGGSPFAGLRLEWAASDNYTIEAAIEERFFRGRVVGFGDLGIQNQLGFGLFIFREWGY